MGGLALTLTAGDKSSLSQALAGHRVRTIGGICARLGLPAARVWAQVRLLPPPDSHGRVPVCSYSPPRPLGQWRFEQNPLWLSG